MLKKFLGAEFVRPFYFFLVTLIFSFQSLGATHFKKFIGFPDGSTGLGVVLGEPALIRYMKFTGWKSAWSWSAGYSFDKVAVASGDYLWYFYNADDKIRDEDFWNSLMFYAGVGARVGVGLPGSDPNDAVQVGANAVGGVEYVFVNSPWSFRVELSPTIFFKAKNTITISAGVGFTYYWFDGAAR